MHQQPPDFNIPLADARLVFLLMGECCELGQDPKAWRLHLARGICEMMNSVAAINGVGLISENGDPAPRPDLMVTYENRQPVVEQLNKGMLAPPLHEGKPIPNPLVMASFPPLPGVVKAFRRSELVPDEEWYQSPYYEHVQRPAGLDDVLAGLFVSENGNAEFISSVQPAASPFDERQTNMFKLLVTELETQLGDRLSYLEGTSFLDIPPKTRRVLLHLLEGESEKQIAEQMGVSKHTVHEHVKKLHQRYDVSSRGELLSKFMARAALNMMRETVDEDLA